LNPISEVGFTIKWLVMSADLNFHAKHLKNMSDLSLIDEALDHLRRDLTGDRCGIAAQSGVPFAILRYAPTAEFIFRRKARLFANELRQSFHKSVCFVSLARLVWTAVAETDGVEYLFETEKRGGGVQAAQNDLGGRLRLCRQETYSIASQVLLRLQMSAQTPDVLFLVRSGGIAPHIYRSSTLLSELHELGIRTPTILCYPGSSVVGTDLRFFDLPSEEGLGAYNYRVKIYGAQ
jgi:hypothetical protein